MTQMTSGFSSDDPWSAYVDTIVEVIRPDATDLSIRSAPPGQVGVWPWATMLPIVVLTAWDPGEERFSEAVNRRRQAELEDTLRPRARGLWSARGFEPSTGYRDEGVAVAGLDEREVLEVGSRFGQEAVFVWTPAAWTIVSCSRERRLVLGWSLTP